MTTNETDELAFPSNIIFTPGRVFINITSFGCGSGCVYCYIQGPREKQLFLDETEVIASVLWLIHHKGFVSGPSGTLVSLCPDTEPFQNSQSTNLVHKILGIILPIGNPIQISTKQKIPENIFQALVGLRTFVEQVVIFVSCTTISRVGSIEPFASKPSERFENFRSCEDTRIPSCLYMKPVLPSTLTDAFLFVDTIRAFKPSCVCIGVLYRLNNGNAQMNNESLFFHPAHEQLIANGVDEKIIQLKHILSTHVQVPIFHSSICVSAFFRNWFPTPHIWRDMPDLCVKCRECEEDFRQTLVVKQNDS